MTTAPESFNWGNLLHQVNLKGLDLLLASFSEPLKYDPAVPLLQLEVHAAFRSLAEAGGLERLRNHLSPVFGANLTLDAVYRDAAGSPVALLQSQHLERIGHALASVQTDPLFDSIESIFGGKVILSTVRPQ